MKKKTYKKPMVKIERFDLTQKVAAGCGDFSNSTLGKPSSGDKINCGWDLGNMIVWVADTGKGTDCTFPWGENEEFEGHCYNNPNGGLTIFGS